MVARIAWLLWSIMMAGTVLLWVRDDVTLSECKAGWETANAATRVAIRIAEDCLDGSSPAQ